MIIRHVFNILLLHDITYFFKRDFFPGAAADQIEVGTDILFPFLKNEVISGSNNILKTGRIIIKTLLSSHDLSYHRQQFKMVGYVV